MRTFPDGNELDTVRLGLPVRGSQESPKRPMKPVGAFVLISILVAGLFEMLREPPPEWRWTPQPVAAPVQYAFLPENSNCGWPPDLPDEETKPSLVTCTEWLLHVNAELDIGIPDAASQVRLNERLRRGVGLRITPDGHRIAYLSGQDLRFVALDLPTAQRRAISPRLDAEAMYDLRSLEISPDGNYFAVSFAGNRPYSLLTEFATGRTTTLSGFCSIIGMSQDAARTAARKTCPDPFQDNPVQDRTVTLIKRNGAVIGEWSGVDHTATLSPDGKTIVRIEENVSEEGNDRLVTHDAVTGEVRKKFALELLSEPSDAVGCSWLTDDEYVIKAAAPEHTGGSFGYYRFDVTSGASRRIRDLGLNPGRSVALGRVLVPD